MTAQQTALPFLRPKCLFQGSLEYFSYAVVGLGRALDVTPSANLLREALALLLANWLYSLRGEEGERMRVHTQI